MPRSNYYEVVEPATPASSTPRHRQAHSITTNASGIADSTISYGTVDALQSQLSRFPPPPSELPTSIAPSFLTSVAPLKHPQRDMHPNLPNKSPQQPQSQRLPIDNLSEPPIRPNGVVRPLGRQPSFKTYATNGTLGSLSPFDWHEGSSSIDVDPNDDRMLPTSFITSLISSSEHGSPRSNLTTMSLPQNSAQLFSGGNDLDAMSLISDATYPPHNYPPVLSPIEAIPPGTAYFVSSGRSSKTNSVGGLTTDTEQDKPSVQSHTPFLKPANRYESIAEDTMGELRARGEASKQPSSANSGWQSSRDRRQSAVSTRTTKSYVSSLISKMSRAASRKRTAMKPLPPVPTIPTELRNSDYQKFEESMPLPQLANRAEVLSKMLARGHRPHSDHSPSNVYWSTPTPGVEVQWNGVTQTLDSSGSNWSAAREASSYNYHSEEKTTTPNRPVGFWGRLIEKFGKKRVIVMFIVIAAFLIILTVLLGVLLKKKSTSVLPKCPAGKTGTDCDIGTSAILTRLPLCLGVLSRANLIYITLRLQLRLVCVSADRRALVWLRGCLTCFRPQTLASI